MTCYIFDLHVYRGATVQTMVSLKFNMLVVINSDKCFVYSFNHRDVCIRCSFFCLFFFFCTLYVTKCTNHSNIDDCIDVH